MCVTTKVSCQMIISTAIALSMFFLQSYSHAADPRPTLPPAPEPVATDPNKMNYGDISIHLDHQHGYTLNMADAVLRANRPSLQDSAIRKTALFALDEVFHYKEPDAGKSAQVLGFFRNRLELAGYEMDKTKVTDGAVIWKLYDHAFVIRTASVTFAIDLTRGIWWDNTDIQQLTRRIIDQCDTLFVSHEHGDHYDPFVIEAFKAQGKPVILPGTLERDGTTKHVIQLSQDRMLRVVMFPGYQGDVVNNVPIIYTPEGLSFAHTGDFHQSNSTPIKQWDWIDKVKEKWDVNVLMINNWAPKPQQVVQGFDPKLVIPGHENELGHGIDDRKPYWMSYERLQGIEYPFVVMTWGESYYYMPSGGQK